MELQSSQEVINILIVDEKTDNERRIGDLIYKIFRRVNVIKAHTFLEAKDTLEGRGKHPDFVSGQMRGTRSKIHVVIIGDIEFSVSQNHAFFGLMTKETKILQCRNPRKFLELNSLLIKIVSIRKALGCALVAEDEEKLFLDEDEISSQHHNFEHERLKELLAIKQYRHLMETLISIATSKRGEHSEIINRDAYELYQDLINTCLYESGASIRRNPRGERALSVSLKGIGRVSLLALENYLFEAGILSHEERIYLQRHESE